MSINPVSSYQINNPAPVFRGRFSEKLSSENLELFKDFAKEALNSESIINKKLSFDLGSGVSLKAKVAKLVLSVKKGCEELVSELRRSDTGKISFDFTFKPKEKSKYTRFSVNYDKPNLGHNPFEIMTISEPADAVFPAEKVINNSLKKFLPSLTKQAKNMHVDITV